MEKDKIPEDVLDSVAGGDGVSEWEETVSVAMIITAKLQGMTLEEFLRKHPKFAADSDLADYIVKVWNRS